MGVSEERVGEVPGLLATSLSVLTTLSRRVLELGLHFYLYDRLTTWSKKFMFNFTVDFL